MLVKILGLYADKLAESSKTRERQARSRVSMFWDLLVTKRSGVFSRSDQSHSLRCVGRVAL